MFVDICDFMNQIYAENLKLANNVVAFFFDNTKKRVLNSKRYNFSFKCVLESTVFLKLSVDDHVHVSTENYL